jgi:hypothetical protein
MGALLAQPSLQCDHQRAAALIARVQPLPRRQAVERALDREQGIDALDRLDGDRRLVDPGEIDELAPHMCPAHPLDDRARLAACSIEPVEPGIRRPPASTRHNSPDAVRDVWRQDQESRSRRRPAILAF